jgi:hypothetical protein
MLLTKRRQWALAAGIAGAAAAQLTDHLMTSSWRLAARKDPPEDPAYDDVDWTSAIVWTVAAGAAGALTQMFARHGAGIAWKKLTGERPPRRRKRKRVRSRREAFV